MKKLVIYLLFKLGYRIHNISKEVEILKKEKWSFLKDMDIKTILDIGANEGQFVEEIYNIFPEAKIYSFEPLTEIYQSLKKKIEYKTRLHAYNIALGEQDGEKTFYMSSGSASSSVLKMGKLHKILFPDTATITEQVVTIKRLDNVEGIHIQDNLMIKIDVQGAEDKVILGGIETFKKAKIIITEVSYATLYENQPLFKEIFSLLDKINFKYIGNIEQFYHPKNNAPLFSDAIFVNQDFYERLFN
jgi:FkbM family methyltransferase